MTKPNFKLAIMATGVAMALAGTAAEASHFRGAAMIPSVNASGLLTVTTTNFWRPTAVASAFASVGGATYVSSAGSVIDTSDSRFTKVTNVDTYQLPGAGTYAISWGSCCRVEGIRNWDGFGSSSVGWTMNSTIVWNGSSANTPILFNFSNVQPEVLRGANYVGNLSAASGSGLTLSYNQVLNGIPTQPPGFTVNPATGALSIPAVNTAAYLDNSGGNAGADYAFSGTILASDGSSVEFDWLFDAVNTSSNNAPTVNDLIINALIGDTVNATVTATDDGLPSGLINWADIGLLGGLGTCSNAPSFNTGTQAFSWNTAGCTAGTYIYQVQASDTLLTDFGTITVNLSQRQSVPEPATLSLFGLGVLALGAFARRRKS